MRFVTRHGGKVEQNYRAGVTSLYVETGMKIKARNMVAMQTVDVVAGKWALDQVTSRRLLELATNPREVDSSRDTAQNTPNNTYSG